MPLAKKSAPVERPLFARLMLLAACMLGLGMVGGYFIGRNVAERDEARAVNPGEALGKNPGSTGSQAGNFGIGRTLEEEEEDRRGRALAAFAAASRQSNRDSARTDALLAISQLSLADLPTAFELARKLSPRKKNLLIPLLIARWAEFEPKIAVEYALAGKFPLQSALTIWAKKDAGGAKAWALGLADPGQSREAVSGVVDGLAEVDPAGALAWLKTLPPEVRAGDLYMGVFEQWAEQDPLAASQQAAALPLGNGRMNILREFATTWAGNDPESALSWARNLPESGMHSADAAEAIFRQWGKIDPERAAAEAGQFPVGPMRNAAFGSLIATAALHDLDRALQLAEQIPAGPQRDRVLLNASEPLRYENPEVAAKLLVAGMVTLKHESPAGETIFDWSKKSPFEAFQFVTEHLPEGDSRKALELRILQNWAENEPRAALDLVLKNGRNSPEELQVVFGGWAMIDPVAALAWARSRPEETQRVRLESRAVAALAWNDPRAAAEAFIRLPAGELSIGAAGSIALSWTRVNPVAATEWAETLQDEKARAAAYSTIAANWIWEDAQQTAKWLGTLPADASRDAAVEFYAQALVRSDPAGAAAWAETIGQPRQREDLLQQLYLRWQTNDANAANQWLESSKVLSAETMRKWKK